MWLRYSSGSSDFVLGFFQLMEHLRIFEGGELEAVERGGWVEEICWREKGPTKRFLPVNARIALGIVLQLLTSVFDNFSCCFSEASLTGQRSLWLRHLGYSVTENIKLITLSPPIHKGNVNGNRRSMYSPFCAHADIANQPQLVLSPREARPKFGLLSHPVLLFLIS